MAMLDKNTARVKSN